MAASVSADLQLLGVSPSSSFAEVRAAWRGLVRLTHPDVSADAAAGERMALINAAYDRIVAAIEASADHEANTDPPTPWADRWAERYAERRMERRAAAEVGARAVRRGGATPYARDPDTIRRRYAHAFV